MNNRGYAYNPDETFYNNEQHDNLIDLIDLINLINLNNDQANKKTIC